MIAARITLMPVAPPPRIYGVLARDAPVGVVFRRGPSKWVELIRLDLAADRVERGAWFHGRIYEDRSDLSPDGDLLIYVAADHANTEPGYGHAWTAVSRPPWLTALALWSKGDTYYGGGLFEGPRELWLDTAYGEPTAHPDHPAGPLAGRSRSPSPATGATSCLKPSASRATGGRRRARRR